MPGGIAAFPVKADWSTIHDLIKKEQADAGKALLPGGRCTRRLANNEPVRVPITKSIKGSTKKGSLIEASINKVEGHIAGEGVIFTKLHGEPNIELAKGLEIIPRPYLGHRRGDQASRQTDT